MIREYLNSLSQGGRRRLDEILQGAPGTPVIPEDLNAVEHRDLVSPIIDTYETVEAGHINSVLSDASRIDRTLWAAAEKVDQATRNMKAYIEQGIRLYGSSVERMNGALDSISDMQSIMTTYDSLYVEHFNGLDNTDIDDTSISISGGKAQLASSSYQALVSSVSIAEKSPASSEVIIDGTSATIRAIAPRPISSNITGVSGNGLLYRCIFTFSSATLINEVTVTMTGGSILMRLEAVNSGKTTVISDTEISITGNHRFSFSGIEATSIIATVRKEQFDLVTVTQNIASVSANTLGMSIIGSQPPETIGSAVNTVRAYNYLSSISIAAANNTRSKDGTWTSSPIIIDGDIMNVELDTITSLDNGTNVTWYLSVNGSQWLPTIPRGIASIESEPVDINTSGRGLLTFKSDPAFPLTVNGLPEGSVTEVVLDPRDKMVIGIHVSGITSGVVYVSYIPIDTTSGLFSSIDSVKGSILIDATTNGQLGERFTATNGSIVALSHDPVGTPEVYVSGIRAILISEELSLNDPSLDSSSTYFKLSGRHIMLNGPKTNVAVYYKHMRSSLRIKAILHRGTIESSTPSVEAVVVGIVHR
jgi:hypothetical protein